MSRRRKNALKRRRHAAPVAPAAPRLTLVPPPLRVAEEALDAAPDAWPILPSPERRRRAAPVSWSAVLHNRRLIYAFAATLVGVVVLLILRWIESAEHMRPLVGPPPAG